MLAVTHAPLESLSSYIVHFYMGLYIVDSKSSVPVQSDKEVHNDSKESPQSLHHHLYSIMTR